jgi:streptogramin lyase
MRSWMRRAGAIGIALGAVLLMRAWPALAAASRLTAAPVALHFPKEVLGAAGAVSNPKPVTISNPNGNDAQPITISSIAVGGDDAGDFAVSNPNACGTLNPGQSCKIEVTFTPGALGKRSATLTITDTSGNSTGPVELHGTGVRGALRITPTSLRFGRVNAGGSRTMAVTLANRNRVALVIGSIAATNDQFSASQNCIGPILSGAACQIAVTFRPAVARKVTGSRVTKALIIGDDAANSPQRVALAGVSFGTPLPPTPTATSTPTASPAPTATIASTATPALTATPAPTVTPASTATPAPTATPASTATIASTATPAPTPTLASTATPTPTAASTPTATPAPTATPSNLISGMVQSGRDPIAGSAVTLYAFGSAGYGQGAIAVASAVTDGGGNFSVGFNCPSGGEQIYLTAQGGSVGAAGADNTAISMLAVLGNCATLASSFPVVIDEMTTVASVWAMAQFIATPNQIGGPSPGITNAARSVPLIADVTTGLVQPNPPATAAIPAAKLNALADILAVCASSAGPSSIACTTLFADAAPSGGQAPADTLGAALEIALNPAHNTAALFNLIAPNAPYQPALAAAPTDWTIAIEHRGGGLSAPTGIAVDAPGNVWIANYNGGVTELGPNGAPLSPSGFANVSLEESFGIAIDQSGNVWVTDEQSPGGVNSGEGALTELSASGAILSGSRGYSGGGLDFPEAVAIDGSGNAWVANFGDASVTKFSPAGSAMSPAGGFTGGGLAFPVALAFDRGGKLWVSDQGTDAISEFDAAGSPLSPIAGYVGGGLDSPYGIATDLSGDVWVANYYGSDLAGFGGGGAPGMPFSPAGGFIGGGLDAPVGVAIDGAGNVWMTNYHGMSVSELAGIAGSSPGAPLSGVSGYTDSSLIEPYGIAIDPSGNVWVADNGGGTGDTVTELIGAAAPVKAPLIGPATEP